MADEPKDGPLKLDPIALRAAQKAADAAGLSLEDWLSRAIVENARRLAGPEAPEQATASDDAPAADAPAGVAGDAAAGAPDAEPGQESLEARLPEFLISRGADDGPPPPPPSLAPGESITIERRKADRGPTWATAVLLLVLALAAAAIWFLPRDLILGSIGPAGTTAPEEQSWSAPLPPPDEDAEAPAAPAEPAVPDAPGGVEEPADPDDGAEAERLRADAEAGDIDAQFELGRAYLYGEGTAKDPEEAAHWIFQAAQTGMPDAQYYYGVLLQHGVGVRQDRGEAVSWFQRAANAGHARAQHNMGVAYLEGEAVPHSFDRARSYFERAAQQGYPEAQYNLGALFEQGMGVEPDLATAFKWYALATEAGNAAAERALNALIPRMSERERERGQQLVYEERNG